MPRVMRPPPGWARPSPWTSPAFRLSLPAVSTPMDRNRRAPHPNLGNGPGEAQGTNPSVRDGRTELGPDPRGAGHPASRLGVRKPFPISTWVEPAVRSCVPQTPPGRRESRPLIREPFGKSWRYGCCQRAVASISDGVWGCPVDVVNGREADRHGTDGSMALDKGPRGGSPRCRGRWDSPAALRIIDHVPPTPDRLQPTRTRVFPPGGPHSKLRLR